MTLAFPNTPHLRAGPKTSWAWWGLGQFQRQNWLQNETEPQFQSRHCKSLKRSELKSWYPQICKFCYWWARHGPYPQLFYSELDCNLCEEKNRNPALNFTSEKKTCHNCIGACPCHNKEELYLHPCPFKKCSTDLCLPQASQFDYKVLTAPAFSQEAWANSVSKSSWLDSNTGWTSSVGKWAFLNNWLILAHTLRKT